MYRRLIASSALAALLVSGCSVPFQVNVAANNTGVTTNSTGAVNAKKTAPSFSLEELKTGQKVSLNALLAEGHPVILNTFASWCGPCNQEAPELQALAMQYRDKVTFVGVNITDGDTLSGVKKFVTKYQLTYPVLLDHQDMFADAYGVVALPTTYVISPDGIIVATHQGALTKTQAEAMFSSAAKLA